ncbi:MAG TPA: flagellin, partial [Burkholderiales bacterium]|nr:flagellin [Burkholderiales bacterium]
MSLGLMNSLGSIGINQYLSTQAMSSGKKLNTASDNPAAMAESVSFSVQISSTGQAISNAQNSESALNTAQGGVGQIAGDLQNISTLSVQAGNGVLNAADRQAIQAQVNQSLQDINQTVQNTQFNGQPLLNGNQGLSSQTGPNVGNTQAVPSANLSSAALGVNGIDITTQSGQSSALSSVSSA